MDWKTKLEDVNSLPAETLTDKNEAWEKLHNRLRQKSGKVKAIWYWVAAASLLLMATISVIIPGKKQNGLVRNIRVNIPPAKAPGISPSTEVKTALLSSFTKKKNSSERVNILRQRKSQLDYTIERKQMTSAGLEEKKLPQQQPSISSVFIDSNVVTTIVTAPVEKKLRVVHINELVDTGEETPNLAKSYERHSFGFKLINKEVYTSFSPSSNYANLTLFKSKNIPSN